MIDASSSNLTAADLMTASPRTCSPFSSVVEAVLIFRAADCGAVPVVDAGHPLGIVTDRDVARASADGEAPLDRPVTEIMTTEVVLVTPEAAIEEVRTKLGLPGVHHLLVVDAAGQLLGIIAASDVAGAELTTRLGPESGL